MARICIELPGVMPDCKANFKPPIERSKTYPGLVPFSKAGDVTRILIGVPSRRTEVLRSERASCWVIQDDDFEVFLVRLGGPEFLRLPRNSKNTARITANATRSGNEKGMFSGENSFEIMAAFSPGRGKKLLPLA